MAWFKVDDKLHDHRKARKAGRAAMGVWVLAGSWAADNLTDGFVPEDLLPRWGTRGDAAKLVSVGLWHEDEQDGEKGWRFHEWLERQPSRAEKMEQSKVRAEAGRRGGLRSGRSRSEAKSKQVASPPLEPPSRPVPSPSFSTDQGSVKCQHKDEPDDRFDEFWDIYDKKVGKKKAEAKWRLALKKRGVTADLLIESAQGYIAWQKSQEKHPEFTKDPTTWLNGEHWNDERPSSPKSSGDGGPKVFVTEEPPDGLSADEYRQWYDEARKRAAS